jgi:hypothetical protein
LSASAVFDDDGVALFAALRGGAVGDVIELAALDDVCGLLDQASHHAPRRRQPRRVSSPERLFFVGQRDAKIVNGGNG